MKNLISYILQSILEKKSIKVDEEVNDGFTVFRITAPKEYMGKVIGKGGRTINSIKNILKIRAIKEGKKVDVQVVEGV